VQEPFTGKFSAPFIYERFYKYPRMPAMIENT